MALYLLSSHTSPAHPGSHWHVNEATPSMHLPPFWHGLDAQSSISKKEYLPWIFLRLYFCFHYLKDIDLHCIYHFYLKHTFIAVYSGVAFSTSTSVRIDSVSAYSSIITRIRVAIINIWKIFSWYARLIYLKCILWV